MSKYVGAIYEEFFNILRVDDSFTVGQKLANLEKIAGKKFINMSDLEVYNAIQKTKEEDYHRDEKPTEDEFKKWIDAKYN
tara:strand:+ start:321 stop:560 length:240 start_codon:yes stop_codon:yes gene_type:complete